MLILVRVYGGGLFENSVSPGSESAKEWCFWTQKCVLNLELDNSPLNPQFYFGEINPWPWGYLICRVPAK